jgi:DNA-binding transcriptional regulator YhcF (GntR family)
LPSIRALAPALGVSVRVTAKAVKAMAAEGLVSPRSRLGSIVL